MTETRAPYNAGGQPETLNAFRNRPSARPFSAGYEPPEPEEIDALIKLMGWSQGDVAKLVGATYNPKKGSTTLRKWRAPKDKKEHREIPYSAWRLMLLYAGVVTVEQGGQVVVDRVAD